MAVISGSPEYRRQRRSYYYSRGLWLLLWGYGIVTTIWFVPSTLAAVVLVVFLLCQLHQLSRFETHLQRLFLERYRSAPIKELELRVDESGITEAEGDVLFSAPWRGVQDARIDQDLLLIRIVSGHNVVVPRHSLEPGNLTLELLLEEISSQLGRARHGIESPAR
jgi:hypothetical protein